MRRVLATVLLMLLTAASGTADPADNPIAPIPPPPLSAPAAIEAVPARTPVRFHLTTTISSNHSKSGTPFTFVLLDPIVVGATTLAASGTTGTGTLILAGHAGTSGHEGDLTLRLDTIPTLDGRTIAFTDQLLHIDGRNKKIMSGLLGFIPYAGFGARFIRGEDVTLEPGTPINTVLEHPAPIDAIPPATPIPPTGLQTPCPAAGCAPPVPAPSAFATATPAPAVPLR